MTLDRLASVWQIKAQERCNKGLTERQTLGCHLHTIYSSFFILENKDRKTWWLLRSHKTVFLDEADLASVTLERNRQRKPSWYLDTNQKKWEKYWEKKILFLTTVFIWEMDFFYRHTSHMHKGDWFIRQTVSSNKCGEGDAGTVLSEAKDQDVFSAAT